MRSITSAIDAAADAAGAGLRAEREADASKIAAAQRRAAQIDENRRIGAENVEPPQIGQMSLDDMLARCVLVKQKGSPVVVIPAEGVYCRASVLDLSTFVEAYRASIDTVTEGGQVRTRTLTKVWRDSPKRIVVDSMMMALGRPRYLRDHAGRLAVNLWTPRKRTEPRGWKERVQPFLDHVEYLVPVPEERERFLDWLAHIEQRPEVLPHYGYLFWTPAFGIGRNWLSSVLTRVWRGEVAASLDLEGLLTSGFNGAIGGGIRCAIADEVRMGASLTTTYHLEQRLRSMMTAEEQLINPKYGHQYREWNCARWLCYSNHADALRLTEDDRRFAVVRNPDEPRAPDYYAKLYAMVHDPEFIDSVAWLLHKRDVSRFNPGERPVLNAAKLATIEATKADLARDLSELLAEWEAPVAASFDLMRLLGIPSRDQTKKAHFGKAMSRARWTRFGKVRVPSGSQSVRLVVWIREGYAAESAEAVAAAVEEYRNAPWFAALGHEPDECPF